MRMIGLTLGCLLMAACQSPQSQPSSSFSCKVQDGQVLQGPGAAPRPGDAPFKPSVSVTLVPEGELPKGTVAWITVLPLQGLDTWRQDGKGDALQGKLQPAEGGTWKVTATLPSGKLPAQPQVGVELRLGEKVLARMACALKELFLPASPGNRREQDLP